MELTNEDVIHVKKEGIQYLQFKRLLEYDNCISHCFTLKPLNFGNNETYPMEKEKIMGDYKKICKHLKIEDKNIVRPLQIHSHNIKKVNKVGVFIDDYIGVDGLISTKSNQILSLTYADCIPLYFFDPQKKVVSNIHSGWQGTLQRIGEKAVRKLINEFNCDPKDIICVIGPSIRQCHFEVDEDIKEEFRKVFPDILEIESAILRGKNISGEQKYYIDTVELNKGMLLKARFKREKYNRQQDMHSL